MLTNLIAKRKQYVVKELRQKVKSRSTFLKLLLKLHLSLIYKKKKMYFQKSFFIVAN